MIAASGETQTKGPPADATTNVETFDVIIVGAGISGIGSARYLQRECPDKRYVILEGLETFGGTWHTHRFPGVRSDTDLYTFGYSFKPWTEAPLATRERIIAYLGAALDENDIARHIRYRHRVLAASWSSVTKQWTLDVENNATGERLRFQTGFLWMCQGYYRHAEGYTPNWTGMNEFSGRIVHPQTWPEDLDYTGKNVVVIGSGATAATLVPAMAGKAGHITMVQRSPTFYYPGNNADELADRLRALEIDEHWIHAIVRKKLLAEKKERIRRCLETPEVVAGELIRAARERLGPDIDVEKHFTPKYRVWQQRLTFVPDGDFFESFRNGKATIVTDEIESFTAKGLKLKSGSEIEADIIVTATGFNLCVMGDIAFDVDGKQIDFSDTVTYQGMMFTGVPNFAWVFGYFRAGWTLRVELVAEVICRLLNHMTAIDAGKVTVSIPTEYGNLPHLSWSDPDSFNPSYLMRDLHLLPKRLDRPEWQHTQDYWSEKDLFPQIDFSDAAFVYE